MLTMTPPEIREDEQLQVDEKDATDDRGIILGMSRRLEATRKRRQAKRLGTKVVETDCRGFNYIQLIVGMIIFVALSRIVGPPAFRMITRARSTALSANIQTAAETVRNVLAIDPAKRSDPGDTTVAGVTTAGQPPDVFLAALTDDAPFNWEGDWALSSDDDSDTIRVQFIDLNAPSTLVVPAAAAGTTPPQVAWLLNDWDAVRIQARNQDGAWACALVVLKPDASNIDTDNDGNVDTDGDITNDAEDLAVDLGNARLRGIWYDSGDTYDTSGRTANGVDHCSPVLYQATQTNTDAPLPSSADEWTITTGRVLTRNA